MINPMTLHGRRILVTGASSGIGRACAVMASQLGATVILTARRIEALEETRAMMEEPNRHCCVVCDLSELDSIAGFVKEVVRGGKIDGLVHAAGVSLVRPAGMVDLNEARKVFELNALSLLGLMKYFSKTTHCGEHFSCVAVSSVSSEAGWPGGAVYCGTKGAVNSIVRALAVELAPKKFRVNAVCPSAIKTPMFDATSAWHGETVVPGSPGCVASAACFLLSDAASFITGVVLPVDNGFLSK